LPNAGKFECSTPGRKFFPPGRPVFERLESRGTARVIVASIATYLGYAESLADARGTVMAAAQTRTIDDLQRLIPPHNGRPEL
jgi:hypothetical protein